MTTVTASAPSRTEQTAKQVNSPSQTIVLAVASALTLIALLAGLPILAIAFFGAVAGSVFSLLIDYREDLGAARVAQLQSAGYAWH